jgi:glucan phosphorylase
VKKSAFNLNSLHQQLIIAGLAGLVEDEGLSPHEAFEVLEEIKRNTFHALAEIGREAKG